MKLKISIPILCLKKMIRKIRIRQRKYRLFNTNHFEIPIDASVAIIKKLQWMLLDNHLVTIFNIFVSSIMKEHLKVAYSGDELLMNYLEIIYLTEFRCFDANHQNNF